MSIVLAASLSDSDLALLGNNIRPSTRVHRRSPDVRANRRVLAAVNRSLAALDERIARLHPRRDRVGGVDSLRTTLP